MAGNESGSAQVPPTRQTGAESATGVALAVEEHEIPQGADRGSKVEIAGGDPKPDVEGPENVGAQNEPARFTSNGQIPHNTVPSPTGAVPVGALGLSVEDSEARVEEANAAHDEFVASRGVRKRLAPETVRRLSAIDVQAIAEQRGYILPADGGARMTRDAFLKAQDEDEQISDDKPARSPRKSARKKAAKKSTRRR